MSASRTDTFSQDVDAHDRAIECGMRATKTGSVETECADGTKLMSAWCDGRYSYRQTPPSRGGADG